MAAPNSSMDFPNSTPKRGLSRRDFLKVAGILGMNTFVLGLTGFGYARSIEPAWVDITHVKLALPRLPRAFSGFRIAQLSDIHFGSWMTVDRFREVMSTVEAQAPDLLALTGDYVFGHVRRSVSYADELGEMSAVLSGLARNFTIAAIMGNHDYWYDSREVKTALTQGGARLLLNSSFSLERDGERFHVAGVDDAYDGHDNLEAALAQLPANECAMLLAHEPDFADTSAATGRFDLQISGHSHGGQVVLPFIGAPLLPSKGHKYPQGLYKIGNMYQYTNRGIGMTFPPVRFNCRPEITIFTLERA